MTTPTIAERVGIEVMGWKPYTDVNSVERWSKPDDIDYFQPRAHWHPDTSWSDAGLVVERMREMGWDVLIGYEEGHWFCRFSPREGDAVGDRDAETAPLAIARAALAAVEARKP